MNLTLNAKTLFYTAIIILILVFLYVDLAILAPFVMAIVFAYVFNPLISFFAKHLKIPRFLSILLVYIVLSASVIFLIFFYTAPLVHEIQSIEENFEKFVASTEKNISSLPGWIRPYAADYRVYLTSLTKSPPSPLPIISRAFSGLFNLFIFFFSAFFFLKDGGRMLRKLMLFIPNDLRVEAEILLQRINRVLGNYLRGQLFLIFVMVIMLFVSFTALGIRYALSISLISSLFEIVPIIGPIFAGILGIFIVLISGGSTHFIMTPFQTILVVAAVYFITRQIQDYAVSPVLIGRATELHPIIILFSVLAGQHLAGVLGVLLAVPVAATVKIMLEFLLDKINSQPDTISAETKL